MITRQLVKYVHGLREVPPEVSDRARYLLLDYLGCLIAGSRAESSQSIHHRLEDPTHISNRCRQSPTRRSRWR